MTLNRLRWWLRYKLIYWTWHLIRHAPPEYRQLIVSAADRGRRNLTMARRLNVPRETARRVNIACEAQWSS